MLRSLVSRLVVVIAVAVTAFFVVDVQPRAERAAPADPGMVKMLERSVAAAGGIDVGGRFVLQAHADPVRASADESLKTTRIASERKARSLAFEELVRQLQTLSLDDGRALAAAVDERALRAAAAQLHIVDTVYWSDGGVDLVVAFPLAIVEELVAPAHIVR